MIASTDADLTSDADVVDDSSSPALGGSSSVPCTICSDLIIDDGRRSTAKLNCGHEFHLDCIGSDFNKKGAMQCPNCHKVERGRWLYADGSEHSDIGAQDSMPNEGAHEFSYSGRPHGFHWGSSSGLTVHSSFEEADSLLNTFANVNLNHAMIPEHSATQSFTRSNISYFQPGEHVGTSTFHRPWNSLYAPHNNLHSTNIQQQSQGWECHFLPYCLNSSYAVYGDPVLVYPATMRSARAQTDAIARYPSFLLHPLHYTQRPVFIAGESSVANRYPSYIQELPRDITNIPSSTNLGSRRFSVTRGLPAQPSRPDHRGGVYIREPESSDNQTHPS